MAEYRFDHIVINITEKKKPIEEDKYTYIGLEHLDSQNLMVSRWGSDIAPKGEKLVMKKGDVLFGKRRAYQKKVAIAPFDGIFSAHGMVLRPNEEIIDKNFFPLFISSDYFLDAAIKISVGSLSPTINWRDLKELKFHLPDLDKQKKLADMLWSINRTLLRYKELLNKTDELVKSQFMEQFEGYEKTRLGEIANITAGQSSPHDDEFSEEGTPFIKAGNLEDLKLLRISEQECNLVDEKTIKEKKLKLHNSGTVLVAKSGMSCLSGHIYSLKKAAYVVSHLACIQPIDMTSTTEYIRTFFMTVGTKSLIRDVSYPAIQLAQFAEMEIPDVPYKEQIRFASFVRQSDKSKFELEQTLSELNATYKRIIEENLG
ncbi:hypothetical protein EUCA11A_21270 [Eubacterium callanderi]|uniref:restriction endonuclease subunit S n=1 Tax=Eubacterium callanderi TaxID=53442 RepID=UPI0029FF0D40|nr:restriction endonuclease subunit S [Eubacterium callanderi]WPK67956.1 hypothetical protein EUCA2A_21280 [Eubacterium callanderi]WPK72253.1 hypothetical protein EUCA11A_21270 [Eubacterium callanderi]